MSVAMTPVSTISPRYPTWREANPVVAPASFVRNEYFFASKKIRIEKISLQHIWQSRHSTPDISMIRRQKTLISSLENRPVRTGRYVRLSFETYSSTRSLFLIIYYPELTIEYFNVSYPFLCIKIHGESTCIHYRWYGREKRNGQ